MDKVTEKYLLQAHSDVVDALNHFDAGRVLNVRTSIAAARANLHRADLRVEKEQGEA